jgi:hypothetical protein
VDWIDLAYDGDKWQAVVKTVMNLWVQQYVGNFLTSLETISFSRGGGCCYVESIACRCFVTDH